MKKRPLEAKYFGLVITFCLIISLLFFRHGITAFVVDELRISDAASINITFSDPNPADNAKLNSTNIIINVSVNENVSSCRLKVDYLSNPVLNKTIGGTAGNTYGIAVIQNSNGGYTVGAYTDAYGAGGNDFWIIGLNSSLSIIWNKTYGGAGDDRLYDLKNTSDGGYILVGNTESFGGGGDDVPDVWIIKVNSTGGHQWNKTYGTPAKTDTGIGGQQTTDGGYIIGAYAVTGVLQDYWLIKTNSTGDHQWNKTYGTADSDIATSVQQTSEGGYIIGGYSGGLGWADGMLIIRTNTTGGQVWNVTYGEGDSSNYTYCYSLLQTKENEYIAVGDRWVGGDKPQKVHMIKINSSGSVVWNQTYGGQIQCSGQKVLQTTDGGFAIGGWYGASGMIGLGSTVWVIKTNASGYVDWNTTFGKGSDSSKGFSLTQTSDGWYAITGGSLPEASGYSSAWLLKINSSTQTYTSAFEFNMTNFNGDNRTSAKYNLSSINESSYSYYAICNDSSNETNSSLRRSMTIDRTSPNITILTPLAGQSFIIDNYNLTVSLMTDEAATCRYNLTNSTFNYNTEGTAFSTTGATTHTFYFVIALDVQYSVYIKCADSIGNIPASGKNHTFTLNSYPSGNTGTVGVIVGGGSSSPSSSNQNGASACTNDCSANSKECSGNGYKTCGDYDSDSCLEWSELSSCGSSEICINGECKATCTNDCSANSKECSGNGYKTCGDYDSDSCLEWSELSSCGSSEICINGECKASESKNQGIVNSIINSFSSCSPNWKCGNWSECASSLNAGAVLSGNLSQDIKERVCSDLNSCEAPIVERKECEREATSITVKAENGTNSFNFNIYSKENGKLLAKISQFLENKKLDILIEGF